MSLSSPQKNFLLASSASPGPRPASAAVQRFWEELPKAQLSSEGDVLQLPEGVFFLGNEDLGSKLFVVPHVYEPLYEEVMRQRHGIDRKKRIVLTGTSGVARAASPKSR